MMTKHHTYRSQNGEVWSITVEKRNGWMHAEATLSGGRKPHLHISTAGNVNDALNEIHQYIEESLTDSLSPTGDTHAS